MAYDPFLRRRRSINEPIVPLPNYIPPMGSGATVGELDAGVGRQARLNRGIAAPGGLSPYYGGTSYTQAAQSSRPAVAPVWGARRPQPRSTGWTSTSADERDTIFRKYATPGSSFPFDASGGYEGSDYSRKFLAGMPAMTGGGGSAPATPIGASSEFSSPIAAFNPAATTPPAAAPAQNAIQRWQGGTALDRRPAPPSGPMYGMSSQRRYFNYTGRIDARSNVSSNERMPGGFTPQLDWDRMFTPQIEIPKARRPVSGYAWE